MRSALPFPIPRTEEEFLALGERGERLEFFDGSLLISPAGNPRRQYIAGRLADALASPSPHVLRAVNVRLQPARIAIPDLVITNPIDFDQLVVDAEAVLLVCEIVSPSNASADKVLKMHYYAAAGIPWYLLVEQETGALHLYRLKGQHYVEHSVTPWGEILHLEEPVRASIPTAELLPPR